MLTLSSRPSLAVACAVVLAHGLVIAWWMVGHEPKPSQPEVTVVPVPKVQSVRLLGSARPSATVATQGEPPRTNLPRPAQSSVALENKRLAPLAPTLPERPVPASAHSSEGKVNPIASTTSPNAPVNTPAIGPVNSGGSVGSVPQTGKSAGGGATTGALNNSTAGTAASDGPPRYLHNPKPSYPKRSRDLQEEGTVVLRVWVSAEGGLPTKVELASSSGSELLNAAALAQVAAWTFEPGRKGGQAQAMQVLVPVPFRLE